MTSPLSLEALQSQARRHTPGNALKRCGVVPWGVYPAEGNRPTTRCGQVWACPRCATRAALERRGRLSEALESYPSPTRFVDHLTLTVPHSRSESLDAVLDRLQGAYRRAFSSGRAGQQLKSSLAIEGMDRTLEVSTGEAGWHPHLHVLLFRSGDAESGRSQWDRLQGAWEMAVEREGVLPSPKASWVTPVSDARGMARYLTKTPTHRSGPTGAFTLLTHASECTRAQCHQCRRDRARWQEYIAAMHGRHRASPAPQVPSQRPPAGLGGGDEQRASARVSQTMDSRDTLTASMPRSSARLRKSSHAVSPAEGIDATAQLPATACGDRELPDSTPPARRPPPRSFRPPPLLAWPFAPSGRIQPRQPVACRIAPPALWRQPSPQAFSLESGFARTPPGWQGPPASFGRSASWHQYRRPEKRSRCPGSQGPRPSERYRACFVLTGRGARPPTGPPAAVGPGASRALFSRSLVWRRKQHR